MTDDTTTSLLERLQIHRQNLSHVLQQAALVGGEQLAPLALANSIRQVRHEISVLKQKLRRLGHPVANHPDDEPFDPHKQRDFTLVHFLTVASQQFDSDPDHTLDWRPYFSGLETKRDYQTLAPSDWNTHLLPELRALEARINKATPVVRVCGLARLSAWFAFGYIFAQVARYTLEVDQNGQLWRSDAPKNSDFRLIATNDDGSGRGTALDGQGTTVAVGIGVNRSLDRQVQDYLEERTEPVAALLLLRTEHQYLDGAGDAVALAEQTKNQISAFVDHWRARRLLFFYAGPLSGACFIGHRMNAVCRQIQLMEHTNPGYTPSFLLE